MARSDDGFLIGKSDDVTLDGEIWGLELRQSDGGVKRYGIAGADGQAEKARKEAEQKRAEAEEERAREFGEIRDEVSGASMAVGSVASGESPSASITGGPWDWELNLTLPKGPKGDKGDPGDALAPGTVLQVPQGGTGATSAPDALESLGAAPASHTHPWSDVTGKPSTYAPSAHAHDDRYYTESEVDSKLGGKANSSHNHSAASITSGALPVARGGTGAGDVVSAMRNLNGRRAYFISKVFAGMAMVHDYALVDDDIRPLTGKTFQQWGSTELMVLAVNGDYEANNTTVDNVSLCKNRAVVRLYSETKVSIRINFIVIVPNK